MLCFTLFSCPEYVCTTYQRNRRFSGAAALSTACSWISTFSFSVMTPVALAPAGASLPCSAVPGTVPTSTQLRHQHLHRLAEDQVHRADERRDEQHRDDDDDRLALELRPSGPGHLLHLAPHFAGEGDRLVDRVPEHHFRSMPRPPGGGEAGAGGRTDCAGCS